MVLSQVQFIADEKILDLWYNFCLCTFILIFKKQNIILQNFKRKHISILCGLNIQRQIKRFIIENSFLKSFQTIHRKTETQPTHAHGWSWWWMHSRRRDVDKTDSLKAGWPTTDQCLKACKKKAFKMSGSIRSKNTPSGTRRNEEISEEQKHLWH